MTWTTHSAAPEWGIDRKTLRRRLADAGHDLEKKKEFTTREISEAIYGDEKLERIKGHRLDNERKEIENREAQKLMMNTADAQEIWNAWALPVRQKLVAIEAELKHRVNPTDPELASKVLKEWTVSVMRLIQSEFRVTAAEFMPELDTEEDATETPS